MAAFVDSTAVFAGRARAIGLPQQVIDEMTNRGMTTIATFAYGTTYVPGAADDTPLREQIIVPLLGNPNHILAPTLRRLFFECFTLMAAELKSRVEKNPEENVRKLAEPERRERFRQLQSQISTFVIREHWEPAHCLVDLYVDMMEKNVLSYVPWEKCVSRLSELAGIRKDLSWKTSSKSDKDKEEGRWQLDAADYTSDFKLYQTLVQARDVHAHGRHLLLPRA